MDEQIQSLEESNNALRAAVAARLSATPADDPKLVGYKPADAEVDLEPKIPIDWILRGERELKDEREGTACQTAGAPTLRPGSAEFLGVLRELEQLHLAKTLDYGIDEDALANIRSSADVVNMPAWAGCILRISDKMHRLKAYFRRGKCEFDGVEDTLKDIACYAAIALVLHRETAKP